MNELEQAARLALNAMRLVHPDFVCNASSHHLKTDLHGNEDVCPITFRWNAAFTALEDALSKQAEPVVEREPLTKAELLHLQAAIDPENVHGFYLFARAIEKAHGIGEEE